MRAKEMAVQLKERIVSRHRSGERYQRLSAALKVPTNTVASIILKWKKVYSTKTPRAGRPAKLNNRVRRTLVREVSMKLMVTLTELQSFSLEMGEPSRKDNHLCSTSTIRLLWKSGQTELIPQEKAHDSPLGVGQKAPKRLSDHEIEDSLV